MIKQLLSACALAWALGGPNTAQAQAAQTPPPPVADFFRTDQMVSAALSPNGRHLAVSTWLAQLGRYALVVIDLDAQPRSTKALAVYNDIDVRSVHWAGNDHLVFTLFDHRASQFNRQGSGLYAVDREGKQQPRVLIRRSFEEVAVQQASSTEVRTRPRDRSLDPDHVFRAVLRDGSPRVLVEKHSYAANWELIGTELMVVNIVDGRSQMVGDDAPGKVLDWVADAKGRARVATVAAGAKRQIHWRPTADAAWQLLREVPRFTSDGGIIPLGLSGEAQLFGETYPEGSDTAVLAVMDTSSADKVVRPVISIKGFDFSGRMLYDAADKVAGVHYLADAWSTHWFDAGMRAAQEAIDKVLPGKINLIDCNPCDAKQRMLVRSFSDRQPEVYHLFDPSAGKLEAVSATRPWIRPAQMAEHSFERIKARDGLELPVHLTRLPGTSGARPTILLVHGGPYERGGEWQWRADAQFLASRGYLVLEPEFRGSTGYGSKLFSAGFKQWGQAMQDDLIDALDWAVKQGLTDPERVCIAGGSYGGYAALMGLVRHGERFRCALNWMGVTDLSLLFDASWSDASSDLKRYFLTDRVGDRKADAAMLDAHSPAKQAAKITKPVLMAYGGVDRRVPLQHGQALADALRKHNPQVDMKVYKDEGHGWALSDNEIDFWTRAEAFLAKHLAK